VSATDVVSDQRFRSLQALSIHQGNLLWQTKLDHPELSRSVELGILQQSVQLELSLDLMGYAELVLAIPIVIVSY
jgi:hypothetical protein